MNIRECVQRGNIVTTAPELEHAGRYIGNGRFGTVIGRFGLNETPEYLAAREDVSRSQWMHMSHWGRFRFASSATQQETTADYLLPLFRLYWEQEPKQTDRYSQIHDFYEGRVTTAFICGENHVETTAWFDWNKKDLGAVSFCVKSGTQYVRLSIKKTASGRSALRAIPLPTMRRPSSIFAPMHALRKRRTVCASRWRKDSTAS